MEEHFKQENIYACQNSSLIDHFDLAYNLLFNGSQPLNDDNNEIINSFIIYKNDNLFKENEQEKYLSTKLKRSKSVDKKQKNNNVSKNNS